MPRINGISGGSHSILIHATSAASLSSSTMDGRQQQRNSNNNNSNNMSIASDRPPPIRKVPMKTSSFSSSPSSLASRFLTQDSAPILPDRMPDNSNNSSSSLAAVAKRRLTTQFRASEKGKGDVLPTHSTSSASCSPLRSRTQSQGSFAISTQIFASSSTSSTASTSCSSTIGTTGSAGSVGVGVGAGVGVGVGVGSAAEPQRSLRSRRKTSMRIQQSHSQSHSHQQHQQFDEINTSEHNNNNNSNTFEPRHSWSDESDSGSIHHHNHHQNAQHITHQQQQHQQYQPPPPQHAQQHNSHNHNNHSSYPSSPPSQQHHQQQQQQQQQQKQKHNYPLQRESSHVMSNGYFCSTNGSSSGRDNNGNKRYYNSKSHQYHNHNQQQTLWLNMTPVQFITVMLLLAITCFVAGSYHKVLSTTEVLKEVKHEESLLLLHLQRVEQASLQLHENLSRLNDRSSSSTNNNNNKSQQERENSNNMAAAVQVDSDLIRIQTEKLREMEAELDHEVRALQKKIQTSARRSIVETYGEGAVQIYLDLYNPEAEGDEEEEEEDSYDNNSNSADANGGINAKNRIAIRLWYDTPHSAWTFLSQVSSGQWDGAVIDWNVAATGGRSIAARSTNAGLGGNGGDKHHQPGGGGMLEPELHFVEQSERGHERYTIGLSSDGTNSMFINLQDNRDFYKSEPCVGTIINGFDVLHRVIRAAQKRSAAAAANGNNSGGNTNPVRIKRALVSHLTRAEK